MLSVKLKTSRREFIDLQSALAIDILLVAPVRMENLAELKFDEHILWPQGQGSPAVILFKSEETKNRIPLEFDLPLILSDRLHVYRNKIAPMVTGRRPDASVSDLARKAKNASSDRAGYRENGPEICRCQADATPVSAFGGEDKIGRKSGSI